MAEGPTVSAMPADIQASQTSRWGWHELASCRVLFDGSPAAAKKASQRWYASQPEELRGSRGERCLVRGDAVLPNGRRLLDWMQESRVRVPAEALAGTEQTRRKQAGVLELLRRDAEFQRTHPRLGATKAAYFVEFGRVHGSFAAQHGLSCKRSAMLRYRVRGQRGELVDGRCNSGRRGKEHDARLLDVVRETVLHPNKFSAADAHGRQLQRAAELGVEPLSPWAVRNCIRELPDAAKVLAREGPRAFAAKAEPKGTLDYSKLPAGDWWCLDGRVADVMVRVSDARGRWKATRPTVTAVLDVRSRKFLAVDVRATENSDGILAGIRAALRDGAPSDVTLDNGKAYRRATGARRRVAWRKLYFDDPRVDGVFAALGVVVHQSLPYQGWAKIIESIWRSMKKRCDRWHRAFWGGSPAERSHVAEELVKYHVDELPTPDEFSEHVLIAVDEHNATVKEGSGMSGLTPALAFEQYRGTVRRVEPEVVDLVACPVDTKPHRVGRDGITYRNLRYTLDAEDLVKLQRREVWVRADIERAGSIILCDQQGRPQCQAVQERLYQVGATQEDLREAMKRKRRVRRAAKAYLRERDFLLETTTGQVLRAKRDRALAKEAELRAQLPAPAEPAVTLVRPDLADAAKKLRRKPARRAVAAATAVEAASNDVQSARERLARLAEIGPAVPSAGPISFARFADQESTEGDAGPSYGRFAAEAAG